MKFEDYFPFWEQLTSSEKDMLKQAAVRRQIKKGTLLHNGSADCVGVLLISSGQLRAYISSDEGREITVYRLFERDISLFSAPCMMPDLQFDLNIEAEKDSELWIISPVSYKKLMNCSLAAANYTNQIMAGRISEIMWSIEQFMWKSFDKRLASFLLEESVLEKSDILKITHEKIASHLGSAREVVTRMLRYFQSEGLVKLTRGTVELINKPGLALLSG